MRMIFSRGAIPSRRSLPPIPSKKTGTVLMETLLVLPLLLMLIMGVVQFARLWQARMMVWYAAYNAARATLVYHPGEYGVYDPDAGTLEFYEKDGVAWAAAAQTLAWVSATEDDPASFWMPSLGAIPNSSGVAGQVRIVPEKSWESNGMVRVTVEFKCPTMFKVFDVSSAFAGKTPKPVEDNAWNTLNAPTFTLTETCVLGKPWATGFFPRMHQDEREVVFKHTQ